jgi:hypothetical protein
VARADSGAVGSSKFQAPKFNETSSFKQAKVPADFI